MSLDELGENLDRQGKGIFPFDQLNQPDDGHLSHILLGNADGGQGGRHIFTGGQVVKPDQGDIFRDPPAGFAKGFRGADGDQVIVGEITGGRLFPFLQQSGNGIYRLP